MLVPSQGHWGFPSFPVVDWFFLFVDLWVLPFPLEDCSHRLLVMLFTQLSSHDTNKCSNIFMHIICSSNIFIEHKRTILIDFIIMVHMFSSYKVEVITRLWLITGFIIRVTRLGPQCRGGTACHSGAPDFTIGFSSVLVVRSFLFSIL
jgi:hypothetical protein